MNIKPLYTVLLVAAVALLAVGVTLVITLQAPEQTPAYPKMTASQVCQYVNQALPTEQISQGTRRYYEYKYAAVNARYITNGEWSVKVRVTMQIYYLSLDSNVWQPSPGGHDTTDVLYVFNEVTGAVTKKQ